MSPMIETQGTGKRDARLVSAPAADESYPSPEPGRHVPGEEGVWVIILGDLVIFALFFLTYCYYRGQAPALFLASQGELDRGIGVINTVLLLTSSWCVASATRSLRERRPHAPRLVLGAMACGVAFVVGKAIEYQAKLAAGITLSTNDFFMFYFMLTGIHLLHVIIGLGVLAFLFTIARRPLIDAGAMRVMEGGGAFWHLVDLLWIFLFALLYVA